MPQSRFRGSLAVVLAIAGAGASMTGSQLQTLRMQLEAAQVRVVDRPQHQQAPTLRDNLQQQGKGNVLSDMLKQLLRGAGAGGRGWRGWQYHGQPTTVAAEKRKARKRRNRLRHKARCRGKRA